MDLAQIIATTAITALTSGTVGAVVASAIAFMKDKKKGHDDKDLAIYDGMKLLVMDKAQFLTQAAVDAGEITIYQRAFIKSLVDVAHVLGANGEMTACAEAVDALPLKHGKE